MHADSTVSEQPVGYTDTYEGAKMRTLEIAQINKDQNMAADYLVGLEGGIVEHVGAWFVVCVVCVMDANTEEMHFGISQQFEIPEEVAVC